MPEPTSRRLRPAASRVAGFALVLAAAVAGFAAAQNIPEIWARYRGSGRYEIRGTSDTRQLTEARVVVSRDGRVEIRVSGRGVDLAMTGRTSGMISRHQIDVTLDRFDGEPTNVKGWIRVDGQGGFEQLELDGQQPRRIGVSFKSSGRNLESAPPRPPVVEPPPPGGNGGGYSMTVERDTVFRGLDYRNFRASGARECADVCLSEGRCDAYTFFERDRSCVLIAGDVRPDRDRDATSGRKRRGGGDGGWNGGDGGWHGGGSGRDRFDVREDYDLSGNDYTDLRTENASECEKTCSASGRCGGFTFNERTRTCYLKERPGSFRRSTGRVSGVRLER